MHRLDEAAAETGRQLDRVRLAGPRDDGAVVARDVLAVTAQAVGVAFEYGGVLRGVGVPRPVPVLYIVSGFSAEHGITLYRRK